MKIKNIKISNNKKNRRQTFALGKIGLGARSYDWGAGLMALKCHKCSWKTVVSVSL